MTTIGDTTRVHWLEGLEREILAIFKEQDKDGSGTIDSEELGHCLRAVGFTPTDEDLDLLVKHFDTNGDGKLTIKELMDNLHVVNAHSVNKQDLYEAFGKFDKNGDGFIRLPELQKILTADKQMSAEQSAKLIDHLVRNFDKNHDGKFDYTEFVDMCLCDHFPFKPLPEETQINEGADDEVQKQH